MARYSFISFLKKALPLPATALLCALCLCLCASPGQSQPAFTPEAPVHMSSAAIYAVIPGGPGWRMYFSTDSFNVWSASSVLQDQWGLDGGTRISTGALTSLDASSITACGILYSTNPADGLRMYYVGVSTAGWYSILSATSTDGVAWGKESGVRLRRGLSSYIGSPAAYRMSDDRVRLFYIAETANGNNPSNYRIYSATGNGVSFYEEGVVLDTRAYQVSVTTLTDGRARLYFTQPLESLTTAPMVKSAISSNGSSFILEEGLRLSTAADTATIFNPVVVRSTESFRWRMFASYFQHGSTIPFVAGALTLSPVVTAMTPRLAYITSSTATFTLTGEIFSPAAAVTFYAGATTMTASGLSYPDDLTITGSIYPYGQPNGYWSAVVTNPDSNSGTLPRALFLDVPAGEITILDNLFRPLKGGRAKISVTVYQAGELDLRLYTIDGGLVNQLYKGPISVGTSDYYWAGRTGIGNLAASGVYLLRVTGPKLDRTERIVVIK